MEKVTKYKMHMSLQAVHFSQKNYSPLISGENLVPKPPHQMEEAEPRAGHQRPDHTLLARPRGSGRLPGGVRQQPLRSRSFAIPRPSNASRHGPH